MSTATTSTTQPTHHNCKPDANQPEPNQPTDKCDTVQRGGTSTFCWPVECCGIVDEISFDLSDGIVEHVHVIVDDIGCCG